MIYFVAMWNGHMRGRDGFYSLPAKAREDAPYRMYPWESLLFVYLHKPVVEDEDESNRERSKLTPCILVEDEVRLEFGALLRRCASLQVHWLESAVGCACEAQHRHRLS